MNKQLNDVYSPGRDVQLSDGNYVTIDGALEICVDASDKSVRPVRLPLWCFDRFALCDYESMCSVVSSCSGVRVRVCTSSDTLRLKVRCTRVDFGELPGLVNDVVAVVDGEVRSRVKPDVDVIKHINKEGSKATDELVRESSTLEFVDLGTDMKTVTIWLPPAMIIDLLGIEASTPVSPANTDDRPVWVHYGSSISHCHTVGSPLSVWPVEAARLSDLNLVNLGFSGECMLDPYIAGTISRTPAAFISISAGVNIVGARTMSERTFAPAMHGFLDAIREKQPLTPILVFSSIYWPNSEQRPGPSDVRFEANGSMTCYTYGDFSDISNGALTMESARAEMKQVVSSRQKTDKNLYYMDGLRLFGPGDVGKFNLLDGLHPDDALYEEIGRRFYRMVLAGE